MHNGRTFNIVLANTGTRQDKKSIQASRKIKEQFDRMCSMIMEKPTRLQ